MCAGPFLLGTLAARLVLSVVWPDPDGIGLLTLAWTPVGAALFFWAGHRGTNFR